MVAFKVSVIAYPQIIYLYFIQNAIFLRNNIAKLYSIRYYASFFNANYYHLYSQYRLYLTVMYA